MRTLTRSNYRPRPGKKKGGRLAPPDSNSVVWIPD